MRGLIGAMLAVGCAQTTARPEPLPARSSRSAAAAVSSPPHAAAASSPPHATTRLAPLNTVHAPWSLAEVRRNVDPKQGSHVWVEAYVKIESCDNGLQTEPCRLAYLSDYPYPDWNERMLLGGFPGDWFDLPARARVRVLASYDQQVKTPPNFSTEAAGLDYIEQAGAEKASAAPRAPSFADGSWSVTDLWKRHDLAPDDIVSVTAFVIQISTCPYCPPPNSCKPCAAPHVILADSASEPGGPTLLVASSAGFEPKRLLRVGSRYRITGKLSTRVGGISSARGGVLDYRDRSAAK